MLALALVLGLFRDPGFVQSSQVASVPARDQAADADAAYVEWSDALLAALHQGDAAAFDQLVDLDAILKRAADGLSTSGRATYMVQVEAKRSIPDGRSLYAILHSKLEDGGRIDLLRLRKRDGKHTALFRIATHELGLAYFEFRLDPRANGTLRATDVYATSTGEYMSSTLHRGMIALLDEPDRDALRDRDRPFVLHARECEALAAAVEGHDPDAFEKELSVLPGELRNEKFVILMRLLLYPAKDPRRRTAVDDLFRYYPDDPCTLIHVMDSYWARGDREQAIAAAEKLRAALDGDPYIDYRFSRLLFAAGDFEAAATAARKAIDGGLQWDDVYQALLRAELRSERFDRALSVLKEMDARMHAMWEDFTKIKLFADFIKTPQYAQWLEYLKSKDAKKKSE